MYDITVALLTYIPILGHPREDYAQRTLRTFLSRVIDNDDRVNLRVHIADDGSPPEHRENLVKIAEEFGYKPTISNADRGGYGRSYNLMMQTAHLNSQFVLPLEDDWELTRELPLGNLAEALEASNGFMRCIRLGYLGFTQELRGAVKHYAGQSFLILDPNSEEPHVFSGHPRLETVAFERAVGVWPEGLPAGTTEFEIAHNWEARAGVAWPLDLAIPASQIGGCMFAHIGTYGIGELMPEASYA